ncbi:MAG: aminotransferase class III-fold pyridoxal phosphate-dependent enzyme [Bryobacteraceae bacterium]
MQEAGFRRTGKLAGYQRYGILPDLSTRARDFEFTLPISCVIGRADVMDLHPPGSMTSTHTGNPICCAAALANIELIMAEDLSGNAARMGEVMLARLHAMKARFPQIGCVDGKGWWRVWLVCIQNRWSRTDLAFDTIQRSVERAC